MKLFFVHGSKHRNTSILFFKLSSLNVMKLFFVHGSKHRNTSILFFCMKLLASQSVIFRMTTMTSMSPRMMDKRSFILFSSFLHFSLCNLSSSFLVGISISHLLILAWASKINDLELAAMKFEAAICPRHPSIAAHCVA